MINGRKIITIYNDGYQTDYEVKKRCRICYNMIYRAQDKHYGICDGCGSCDFSFYKLTPTQQAIVTDKSKIVIVLGGMNNGKTDATVYATVVRHLLQYSNAVVLTISHSLESIQQTVVDTIRKFLPEELVAKKNGKLLWNRKLIELKNGSKMYFFPSDQSQKYRSLNASWVFIPEFTAVKEAVVVQAASRIRKKVLVRSAFFDRHGMLRPLQEEEYQNLQNIGQVIMDGNPEEGHWVNYKFLPYLSKVYVSRDSDISDLAMLFKPRKFMKSISLHNYPTTANPYAADGAFMKMQETTYQGKDTSEYQRYILGKIISYQGLVYPNYLKAVIAPFSFDINDYYYHFGADLGFNNPCAYVAIAEHRRTGICYVFRGYKKSHLDISQNAEMIRKTEFGIPENLVVSRKCDSQGQAVIHGEVKKTSIMSYAEEGIDFTPASKQLQLTTSHLNSLFNANRLKIFNNMTDLLEEFPKYVTTFNKRTGQQEIQKKNCDMLDALRYAAEDISLRNLIVEQEKIKTQRARFNPGRIVEQNVFRYIGQNAK